MESKNEKIEKPIEFPDEVKFRKLKSDREFLKPMHTNVYHQPNEVTLDFIENKIFDRPSFEKPYF